MKITVDVAHAQTAEIPTGNMVSIIEHEAHAAGVATTNKLIEAQSKRHLAPRAHDAR